MIKVNQLEYTAAEILFTLPNPNSPINFKPQYNPPGVHKGKVIGALNNDRCITLNYHTCALTNLNFWCRVFKVV